MKEQELIKACKKNDYVAQMQVYNLYRKHMYNACWRIFKNKQDAEDAVHDAFIKGFQKIGQVREDANLGAWFKRIAINHCLDRIRRDKKIAFDDFATVGIEDKEDDSINYEEVSVAFVKNCIDSFDEKYRIILELYLIEEYNHREISELLGLKESTVRNQFRRGKNKLLTLLKNSNYEFRAIH